jgi:tetratricopeptide (TPR) repeat protein
MAEENWSEYYEEDIPEAELQGETDIVVQMEPDDGIDPDEEIELTPEEQEMADELIAKLKPLMEKPATLEELVTEESLESFRTGEITLGELIGIDEDESMAIAEVAFTMLEQNRLDDARQLAEGLVVCDPFDPYFHTLLASVYLKEEKNEEAMEELSMAIELDAEHIDALSARGEMLLGQGEFEKAFQDLKQAAELDPEAEEPSGARAHMLLHMTTQMIQSLMEEKEGAGPS